MKREIKVSAFVHISVLIAIIILPGIFPKKYRHRLPSVHQVKLVNLPKTPQIKQPQEKKKPPVKKPQKQQTPPKPKKESIFQPKKRPSLEEKLAKKMETTKFQEPPSKTLPDFQEPEIASTPQLHATVSSTDNFPFQWYLDFIQGKISSCWHQPQMTIAKDYTAMVSFTILPDGTVNSLRVRDSSGVTVFDQSTLAAVRTAQPLPPLPPGYKHGKLTVNVEFRLE